VTVPFGMADWEMLHCTHHRSNADIKETEMENRDTDTKQQMDNAANEAERDLENIPNDTLLPTARWIKKWYLQAGHKRLSRILLNIANKLDK
jgi:hypothetical protein